MTRPDYDGSRYGGQGGVLGNQQSQQPQQAPRQPGAPGGPEQAPGQPPVPPGQQQYHPYPPQAGYPGAPVPAPAQPQVPGYGPAQPMSPIQPRIPGHGMAAAPAMARHAPIPGQPMPGQPVSGQPAPGQPMPGQAMPGQAMPGQAMPGQAMPGQAMPGQAMPGQAMPGQAMPGQPMPGQPMPGPPVQGQAMPGPAPAASPVPGQAAVPAVERAGLVNPISRAAAAQAAPTQAPAQAAPGQAAPAQAATALATGVAGTIAAGTTAATATSVATPLAAPASEGPRHGTVYGGRRPSENGAALSGRLTRLHIGWHYASLRALELIGVSSPGTGLILGADVDQRPVPVRFFRTEPTRVTLVGGVWAAQTVVFRALAFGANAVVLTGDPAAWHGFGERATGRADRVTVIHGERPVRVQGTAQQPMLIIHDLGMTGPSGNVDLGPWQTQMTVLRQLDERGVPALQEGHLVMMQRLAFGEATLAASALRLTGESAQLLQQMEDEMVALIGGGADRYVWISPTSIEQRQGGPARR